MRFLFLLIVIVVAAVAGVWLGGETLLARHARQLIAADPRVEAAAVSPLRETGRIGLQLDDLAVRTDAGPVLLPEAELWAAPTSPTDFRLSLPPTISLPVAGAERQLETEEAVLRLRLSPASGLGVSHAALRSGPATLDGLPALGGVEAQAVLVPLGAGAPADARASFEITGELAGLEPAALGPLPPGTEALTPLSAEGSGRLFLTALPRPGGGSAPPQIAGISTEGVTLHMGKLSLRLSGALRADDRGRAEGALFVDTAHADELIAIAADAGLIPARMSAFAGTALRTAAATEVTLPAGVTAPAPAAHGELRLPVIFRDGRVFLGPLPLGDAPVIAPR